jgi:hypothetical protein
MQLVDKITPIPTQFYMEMAHTVSLICQPGKGILAADESVGTIQKKVVLYNITIFISSILKNNLYIISIFLI